MRGNGKLTADEFIDYVFGTEVSGSQKKLLRDLAENGIIETSYSVVLFRFLIIFYPLN